MPEMQGNTRLHKLPILNVKFFWPIIADIAQQSFIFFGFLFNIAKKPIFFSLYCVYSKK